jgi:hypothetical protein
MLIPFESHYGAEACILGLATTLGDDGMDSALEYMLSGARGLLWLWPVVPAPKAWGVFDRRSGSSKEAGRADRW